MPEKCPNDNPRYTFLGKFRKQCTLFTKKCALFFTNFLKKFHLKKVIFALSIGRTLDVFASQLFHDFGRENSWCESSPEDGVELVVKSSHPHLAEVPVWVDDGLPLHFALGLAAQHDVRSLGLFKHDGRVGQRYATADLNQMHIFFHFHTFFFT